MSLSLAQQIRQACRLEATARKAGNVHPEAAFEDIAYPDFLAAADAASPWLAKAGEIGVGPAIEAAVRASRSVVDSNVNLGIALLIAPLAAVPRNTSLAAGIGDVLTSLTIADAAAVYRAIGMARPGGLGQVAEEDVSVAPTRTLTDVMRLAADRDLIARQYANDFRDVLGFGRERLRQWWDATGGAWEESVMGLHLSLLAECPDSLIARKCGTTIATEASAQARSVLEAGWPTESAGRRRFADFDHWLRADGHRRNPGASADLVASILFAALREQDVDLPQH